MDNPPAAPRSFTRSVLPWAVAAAALVLYLATLAGWVTLPALNLTAHILGWDWWTPKIGRPLYHLLTLPVKALPAGSQIFALNAFAAVCSALTLALLARSVALLPQDRTRDQRARLRDGSGLLDLPANWLPPLLAVLACGLQLSFWEHATAATGEALDLLLFAAAIWCLLEFRVAQDDRWLARFALACALGFANNWAMVGFAPFLLVALVWVKGLEFFNLRFLGRLAAWGGAGLLLYLFNPLTASPEFGFSFGDLLQAELGAQKNALLLNPKGRVLLLSLVTLLPLALFGIRWSSGFGDVSAAGTFVSNLLFRLAHAGFLALAVVMALDLPFSPRALGYGQAMLPFYYLGALVIGYGAGYFLLVCGAQEEKAWQKPGPLGKALNFAGVGIVWLGLVALPGWLVMKNLPFLRVQNGKEVYWLAAKLEESVRPGGEKGSHLPSIALSEQPTYLFLLAAYHHGKPSPHLLLDARMLQLTRYHRQLAKRHAGRWPDPGATPDTQVIPPIAIASFLGMQTSSNDVFLLHPPVPAMYLENLYPEWSGVAFKLSVYATNQVVPPQSDKRHLRNFLDPEKKLDETRLDYAQTGRDLNRVEASPDFRVLREYYSALNNTIGSMLLRGGRTNDDGYTYFRIAAITNPSNLVAVLNRDFNESLRTGKPSASDLAKIAQELLGPGQTWGSVLAKHGPPDEPNFCFALGQLFLQSGLPRQAIIQFTRVTELAPTNHLAHLAIADTFLALKVPDRAKAALDAARGKPELRVGLAASESAVLRLDALVLSQKGKTNEAEQAFVDAVKKFPADLPLLDSLTEIYLFSRRFTNALAVTETQLKVAPTSPRALVNKGGILIQMKQFEAALAPLTKLIELQPRHSGAHLNRAIALMNLNRPDDAAKDYTKHIELEPAMHNGHFGLAEIAWQRKQTGDAKKHYEAGLKLAPPDAPETKIARERLKELGGGK